MTRLLRRHSAAWRSRHRIICELYRAYHGENAARAVRLLENWLSSTQRQQFEAARYFDVVGCDSGKHYRVHWGRSLNIYEMDETGGHKKGWCFAPVGNLVEGDVMLAQKIALETFEYEALALANGFLPSSRQPPISGGLVFVDDTTWNGLWPMLFIASAALYALYLALS